MDNNFIGRILGGRYEILEVIGSGGMATVYKAQCKLLNRYVAVKVLNDSLMDDEEVVKRFTTESRAAASMSHYNIVSIYDVGETEEGINYIVMELVEGETLKEYIEKKGALDWREACSFAVQIARALECAHKHEIIHRDIKPHNILITKDGTLKVADFGIARTTNSDTLVASKNAGVFGSVHYISPEQARGGYVDARSDVYSLGVVLYEMVSGKLPFNAENPVSVALMKLENAPQNIRELVPDLPDEVSDIIMKAIAKEQYIRYQSAKDMAYDLREFLDGHPINVVIPKTLDEKKKEKKKKNYGGIILLVAILAVVLGVGSYFIFSGGSKEYQVPDLMDKTIEEAISLAKEAGFEIDEENISFVVSDEFEEGKIMKQDPGANSYVKKNRDIKLVISSGLGEGDIEVPDVVGLEYAEAAAKLRAVKLKYEKFDENSSEFAQNQVIKQSPKSGTKVTEDYEIILYVSTGEPEETEEAELVPVPNLVGKKYNDVAKILSDAGLKIGNVSREESDRPEGEIISQSPKSNSESPKGSYVNVVVSEGIKPTPTAELKRKTFTIQLPETESGTVHLKVVANSATIYDKLHQCSDEEVDIPVAAKSDATVQVYFDGELKLTKVVEF